MLDHADAADAQSVASGVDMTKYSGLQVHLAAGTPPSDKAHVVAHPDASGDANSRLHDVMVGGVNKVAWMFGRESQQAIDGSNGAPNAGAAATNAGAPASKPLGEATVAHSEAQSLYAGLSREDLRRNFKYNNPDVIGNKGAERIFSAEGLEDAAFLELDASRADMEAEIDVDLDELSGAFAQKSKSKKSKSSKSKKSTKSKSKKRSHKKSKSSSRSAMFPLPHNCPKGQALCFQRLRQPSLYDMYRRRRRDEQRAAMNRALLSYSLALDMICSRDTAGIDNQATRRTAPESPEVNMAGYPNLDRETRTQFGYLHDEWSVVKTTTEFGDRVGVGSLQHYNLPE
jgi:hypothetical protein